MVFSNTTDKNGILQAIETYTGLGDGGITGDSTKLKEFTRIVNGRYQRVLAAILRSQDEWDFDDKNATDYAIYTTSLVALQQDYALPTTAYKIKRVEVSYDGSTWKKTNPFDIGETSSATDTTSVAGNFNTASPFYDVRNNAIFLYPIPQANSTNGLKIWVTRELSEFVSTDTTKEPGYDELFHFLVPLGAAMEWAMAKQLPNKGDLAGLYQQGIAELENYYGAKQQDRQYEFKAAMVDNS